MAEGVIDGIEGGICERGASEGTQEPLLLIVGDMRHIPDERGHEGRVLAHELGLGNTGEHVLGAAPGGLQLEPRPGLPRLRRDTAWIRTAHLARHGASRVEGEQEPAATGQPEC